MGMVSLSIKNVPEALAAKLRKRAARNHRSLQRELLALVEAAAHETPAPRDATALAGGVLFAREPEGRYPSRPPGDADDALLAELDSIVAGSRLGEGPLMPREQLHDRHAARDVDLSAREDELRAARRRQAASRP